MQGKPYAGNPHVRFDEGAGAPRHSGRPALLYKTKTILFAALACLCATQTSVAAVAKVWIGGESGDWNNAANWEVLSESSDNSDYIFTNAVTFSNYSINASASAYVHLTNSTAALHFRKGGAHAVRRIYIKNGGSLHLWNKGCLEVDHSGGEIHCDKNSSITCYGENAIPPHLYKFNMTGTLDLGGYNQAITNVATFTYDTYGQVVKSDSPALLTIGGRVVDCNFTGYVRGAAGLCWNPDNSSRTLKMYNYESPTRGELIISNGVVDLNTGSSRAYFSKLSRAVVGPTATLKIPYQSSVQNFFAKQLVVCDGGSILLGDNTTASTCTLPRVTTLSSDGTATDLAEGLYGADDGDGVTGLTWLTGNCFLQVKPTMTCWKAPQDGNWADAANWNLGVPTTALGAEIMEQGGDYTVTVAAPAVATNMTICNLGEGTVTLNVASRLESTKGVWEVGKGGKMLVPVGGEIEYRGIDANVTTKFSKTVETMKLSGGAVMEVRGKANMTNFCGSLVVGDNSSSVTSKVVVAGNGELNFRGVADYSYFKMPVGGRIEVSDYGVLCVAPSTEKYIWSQTGGSLDFSGHSTFDLGGMWDVCLGQGETVFREDAKMVGNGSVGNGSARLYFSAAAGAPTEIWFRDRAVYSAGSNNAHTLLRPNGGGRIVLHFDSAATHTFGYLRMGRTVFNGFVDMHISDGFLYVDSTAGFNQGCASATCDANSFTTGHVYQTGGAFVVNGESGGYQSKLQYGFILGDGLTSTTVREPTVLGVYELSGGVVTNETFNSPFVLGIGRGRGEFIQTGGEFVSNATRDRSPAMFGFSNGYGYYTLSNGTAKISSKIWVGGVSPETCGFTDASYTGTEAVGGITVAAADKTKPCSFTVSDTVVLGGLGEGTLEVGPGGTFSGTDLVLSNNTASVLRLVADDSGFGAVNLSGKLTITDGASLVVDATGFTGANARRCNLLSCASMSGSFAPGRVTVLTDKPTEVQVSVDANGIVLRKIAGTVILLR